MKVNWTDEQTEAMKRLYGQFVGPRDLVFNIGANVGTRTAVFLSLGAEVVAVEPQPMMIKELKRRFRDEEADQQIYIVEAAAGPENGTVDLLLCTDSLLATCAPGWAASLKDRWPKEKWARSMTARQITLDELIQQYGLPRFVKIDVEGYEREVTKGLSYKVPALCFEATIPYVEPAIECLGDLWERLGYTQFNYLVQETMELVRDGWVGPVEMVGILRGLPEETFYVDVFAR